MLNNVSTKDLEQELKHRQDHPEWFIRDLVEEGVLHDDNSDDFDEATAWMDDPCSQSPYTSEDY